MHTNHKWSAEKTDSLQFHEKRGYTYSLTREGLSSALFPSSFSSAFFLLPTAGSFLSILKEEILQRHTGYLGCRVHVWKCKTQGHEKWAPQQYWGLGAHPWRGTVVTLIKFIILSLPLPLNLTIVQLVLFPLPGWWHFGFQSIRKGSGTEAFPPHSSFSVYISHLNTELLSRTKLNYNCSFSRTGINVFSLLCYIVYTVF